MSGDQKKRSRLSQSLKIAVQSKSNEQSSEVGKDASEPNQNNQTENTDAFERAERQTSKVSELKPSQKEKSEEIPEMSMAEDFNQRLDETIIVEEKRPEIIPNEVKKKNGSIVSLMAIVLSVGAIGTAGYVGIKQNNIEGLFNQTAMSLEGQVEGLVSQVEGLVSQNDTISTNMRQHVDTMAETKQLAGLLRQEVAIISEEVAGIKRILAQNSKTIFGQTNDIESLQAHIRQIKIQQLKQQREALEKPAPVINKASKSAPPPAEQTKLEGSTISSIDVWGGITYVMLKEPRNSKNVWIPVAIGDRYKGWTLKSTDVTRAQFTKGKLKRNLEIQD